MELKPRSQGGWGRTVCLFVLFNFFYHLASLRVSAGNIMRLILKVLEINT